MNIVYSLIVMCCCICTACCGIVIIDLWTSGNSRHQHFIVGSSCTHYTYDTEEEDETTSQEPQSKYDLCVVW